MANFLTNLNKNQLEAATHLNGPCIVTAGAGTGKTSVLTARIAYLIQSGVFPENILAITFTNKAAAEMKRRANKLANCELSTISTFHAFGLRLIKENLEMLKFTKKLIILDDNDVVTLIKKIVKDMGYDAKKDNIDIALIINEIAKIKNKLMTNKEINELRDLAVTKTEMLIPDVFYKYLRICRNNCYVDFEDLLVIPVALFKKKPDVLQKYQEMFKYILVDEYQDTNTAQYELIKLLAAKYRNVFVVGDINQNIYSFRMADYRNVLNFQKDYPDAKKITLDLNYRSTNAILDAANSVIKNNIERADVTLYSHNGRGQNIEFSEVYSEYNEADVVASRISSLINTGTKPSDIAVLYRNNHQSRLFEASLAQANVPFKVVGNRFFDRKEIKDLVAYIRLVANTSDNLALKRIINFPKRGIGDKTIENLEAKAEADGISIFDAIAGIGKDANFKKMITLMIDTIKNKNLIDTVDVILTMSGVLEFYQENPNKEDQDRVLSLMDFRSVVSNYADTTPDATLDGFLEELGLNDDTIEDKKQNDNVVTLMTLHKSKGLEFPVVFIVGAEENTFNHIKTETEEERRLMYVGITRAKKELYITASRKKTIYGETVFCTHLRFVDEIDKNCIDFN